MCIHRPEGRFNCQVCHSFRERQWATRIDYNPAAEISPLAVERAELALPMQTSLDRCVR